jgi:hypothetical protein
MLRELRTADAPMRNHDLVNRTGLPKATVSRLLSTLGALGYVRRIDRGSYVLANASTRSGRAMLGALGLERARLVLARAPGPVFLEALVGERWVAVYRWSRQVAGAITNNLPLGVPPTRERADGSAWDAASGTSWVWMCLHIEGVGEFALTLRAPSRSSPSAQELDDARSLLRQAAQALTCAKEQ